MMTRILLIVALFAATTGCTHRPAAVVLTPAGYLEILDQTDRLTCHGSDDRFGSRLARSAALVSPNAARAAYAEVEAIATEWPGRNTRACQNVSTVYVAEGGGSYREVFRQDPGAEGKSGNSIRLVDWSPDGRMLLFELRTWTYPTDVENPLVVVYDAELDSITHLPAATVVTEHYSNDCFMAIESAGFTSDGQVAIRTSPLDSSLVPVPPCTSERRTWALATDGMSFRQIDDRLVQTRSPE